MAVLEAVRPLPESSPHFLDEAVPSLSRSFFLHPSILREIEQVAWLAGWGLKTLDRTRKRAVPVIDEATLQRQFGMRSAIAVDALEEGLSFVTDKVAIVDNFPNHEARREWRGQREQEPGGKDRVEAFYNKPNQLRANNLFDLSARIDTLRGASSDAGNTALTGKLEGIHETLYDHRFGLSSTNPEKKRIQLSIRTLETNLEREQEKDLKNPALLQTMRGLLEDKIVEIRAAFPEGDDGKRYEAMGIDGKVETVRFFIDRFLDALEYIGEGTGLPLRQLKFT